EFEHICETSSRKNAATCGTTFITARARTATRPRVSSQQTRPPLAARSADRLEKVSTPRKTQPRAVARLSVRARAILDRRDRTHDQLAGKCVAEKAGHRRLVLHAFVEKSPAGADASPASSGRAAIAVADLRGRTRPRPPACRPACTQRRGGCRRARGK